METADDWWANLDRNKVAIRELVAVYHPAADVKPRPMEITATTAEKVCEQERREIRDNWPIAASPVDTFDRLLEKKNGPELVKLLSEVWWGLPESRESRSIKGFHTLCDLCSESDLLHSEPESEVTYPMLSDECNQCSLQAGEQESA